MNWSAVMMCVAMVAMALSQLVAGFTRAQAGFEDAMQRGRAGAV
jgi:hypothetical protein